MDNALLMVSHLVIFLALVALSSTALAMVDKAKDDDLGASLKGNCAVAIRHGAFYLALALALFATMTAPGAATTLIGTIKESTLWGLAIVGGMFVSLFLNDTLILPTVKNSQAIARDNRAVAVVEAASFLGSAAIMTGTMSGEGSVIRTAIYFVIGQIAMVLMVRLYDLYDRRNDLQKQIGNEGNLAAALLVGGKMLGIALIIRNAISGDDSQSFVTDLMGSAVSFTSGFIALLVVEALVDRLVIPHVRIGELVEQKRSAPIAVVASLTVATALFVTAVSPF